MAHFNNTYYNNNLSNNQYNAIMNTGDVSLIEIANQAKTYTDSGDYSKAAIYNNYLMTNLNNIYNISYQDNSSKSFYASTHTALNHYNYKKK